MKENRITQKTFTLLAIIFLIGACAQRESTSIDVLVINNSSKEITAKGTVRQLYNASRCKPDYANTTGPQLLQPGETKQIATSIECYGKVRTFLNASYSTNYSVGYINIIKAEVAAKLISGVQFQVTNGDKSKNVTIQVVNSIPSSGNYTSMWSFAPLHALQVAWLNPINSSNGTYWQLHFSLPKGMEQENLYAEFDESLGIDEFGDYLHEPKNGVYRAHIYAWKVPMIFSQLSTGTMICDDVGCNEAP
jgi:hypothetical protein